MIVSIPMILWDVRIKKTEHKLTINKSINVYLFSVRYCFIKWGKILSETIHSNVNSFTEFYLRHELFMTCFIHNLTA